MEILSLVRSTAVGVKVVAIGHDIPEGESACFSLHGNGPEQLFNSDMAGVSGEEGYLHAGIIQSGHDGRHIVIGVCPALRRIIDSLGITVKGGEDILVTVKGPDRVVEVEDKDIWILSCSEGLLGRHGGEIHVLCEGVENYVVRGFHLR